MKYARAITTEARRSTTRAYLSLVYRLLGRHVHSVVAKTAQGYFAVQVSDSAVGRSLRTQGSFGTEQLDSIRSLLNGESRVLVVGAHVGTLAIPLAKSCATVVAIEANPDTFELLKMNVALNGATNCRAIQIAASNDEQPIKFLMSTDNSGGSKRAPVITKRLYYYDRPREVTVPAARLDQLLETDDFDLVLMDIEGSEYFALQGMQRILAHCQTLIVEFLPHHLRYVAGISVAEFLTPIEGHFSTLTVPRIGKTVQRDEFLACLSAMYESGLGDDGIIFSR